jgi:hypothetical protein
VTCHDPRVTFLTAGRCRIVSSSNGSHSYLALRVCTKASAPAWWSAARNRSDVPAAISALLGGRTRVELTAEEAARALDWAASVGGWDAADPKPVFVYLPAVAAALSLPHI